MRFLDWIAALRPAQPRSSLRSRSRQRFHRPAAETLEAKTLLTNLTVTTALDIVDAADGETSLREAILEANATTGYDTITFNISGGTSHTIALAGQPLPTITDAVEIDGSAQTITIDSSTVAPTTNLHVMQITGQDTVGSHVHNLSFANTRYAITATGSDTLRFENIDADWNGAGRVGYAFQITGGAGHQILNSSARNRQYGAHLTDTTDSSILGNDLRGSWSTERGVSGRNTWSGNDSSGTGFAVALSGSIGQTVVSDNNLTNSTNPITVINSPGNLIINNNIADSPSNSGDNSAIRVIGTPDITIAGNDLTNSARGIRLQNLSDITVVSADAAQAGFDSNTGTLSINADLSTVTHAALTIANSTDITVDSFDLTRSGSRSGNGFVVESGTGVTIQNSIARNRQYGVHLTDTTDSSILGNDLRGSWSTERGVSGRNTWSGNDSSGTGFAVALSGSIGQTVVSDNNLTNSTNPITVINSPGNLIINNNIADSPSNSGDNSAIRVIGTPDITIAGNDLTNSARGIRLQNLSDITVVSADAAQAGFDSNTGTLSINADLSTITHAALTIANSTDITIDSFDLTRSGSRSGNGFVVESGTGVTIQNSIARNRQYGVHLTDTTDSSILGNDLRGSWSTERGVSGRNTWSGNDSSGAGFAVALSGSIGQTEVSNNNLSNSTNPITVINSPGNRILNNDIADSPSNSGDNSAIRLIGTPDITIAGNDLTNSARGIRLQNLSDITVVSADAAQAGFDSNTGTLSINADLSTTTHTGMTLVNTSDVTVDGFDLSRAGTTDIGTGLQLEDSSATVVHGLTVGNRITGVSVIRQAGLEMRCSSILDNSLGVAVDSTSSDIVMSENHLEGNSTAARRHAGPTVDARMNYWGAPDGPSNLGGSGDSYSGNFNAAPFLTSLPDCLVTNLPPELTVNASSVSADEGSTATHSGTWSDSPDDVVTLSASVGAIMPNANGTWDWSWSTADGPTDSQTVTITATDGDAASTETTFQLVVNNVAPAFEAGANETLLPPAEGQFNRNGLTFTDPGTDEWTGTVNFGDGSDDQALTIDQGSKSFYLAHVYTADGSYTVTVTVNDDDGGSHVDTFDVTVFLNTPPVAHDDAASTDEDNPVTFNVLTNDTDEQNNIVAFLTADLTSPPVGVLTNNIDGTFTFNPNGDFESLPAGQATQVDFDYQIKDSFGETDSATVTITVNGVNDTALISGDNAGALTEDAAGDTGVMSVSDADDGEAVFQAQAGTAGDYGTFAIDPAGNWSYTRTADLQHLAVGESVSDSFTGESFDGTASEVVTITITGENDAPVVASAGNVAVDEGQTATKTGTWSDIDASDSVTLSASAGVVTQNANGTWSWSLGTDDGPGESQAVVITADDGNGGVTDTSFAVTVNNVAPSSVDISGPSVGYVGDSVTFTLNATDVSNADQAAGFDFVIDWDGNGSVDETVNGPSGTTVSHIFTSGGSTTVIVNAIDKDGGATTTAASYAIKLIQRVDVDVKPGNAQNKVNAKSQGVIPVAIYTTADFDAATIDGSTVELAGINADQFALEDVDGDGDLDLILHFDTQSVIDALGIDLDSGESVTVDAELTGQTIDNVFIEGFDTIEFFQPGKGKGRK